MIAAVLGVLGLGLVVWHRIAKTPPGDGAAAQLARAKARRPAKAKRPPTAKEEFLRGTRRQPVDEKPTIETTGVEL